MVQSIKEYTEDDVTDQMGKGSFPFASSEHGPAFFHGLHSDIEAIERGFFGGIGRFFQAAEEMKNEFFNSIGVPELYDHDSPHKKGGVYIESRPPKEAVAKEKSGDVDLSGLARDVWVEIYVLGTNCCLRIYTVQWIRTHIDVSWVCSLYTYTSFNML